MGVCPKNDRYLSVVGRNGTTRFSVRAGSRSSLQVGTSRAVIFLVLVAPGAPAVAIPPGAEVVFATCFIGNGGNAVSHITPYIPTDLCEDRFCLLFMFLCLSTCRPPPSVFLFFLVGSLPGGDCVAS